MTVVGLVIGALGVAILWASGVEFPVAIPPGGTRSPASARSEIVILLAAALFVGLARWRWIPAAGAVLGLVFTVGFLVSPSGLSNLAGEAGTSVALGQGIQVVGVVTALIAGVVATRANYRTPVQG
jgi:hypothetical protein